LRSAIESGALEWEEYSHFGMISRLQAAAAGLPFLPMNPTGADDLIDANPQHRRMIDPYSGRDVIAVPPLRPDVALIHVQRADEDGNAQLWGIVGEQKEAAFAAERVILTAEEIVPADVIRSDPNRTLIPGLIVTAVCHVPHASHPSYAQGYYDRDNEFYVEWDRISADPARLKAWLREWVYEVKDREAYWQRLGPVVQHRLAVEPRWSAPVNYGAY
jgi:glutaconate CoA-transferase subunit A